ncbi:MAG TPA: hypothetical protein VHE35_04710, partial [Kofleriaceae bacterium]|nr:hypothetical protein [Kofleriaceae bacterium]
MLGETVIAEQTLEHGSFSIGQKTSCTVPLPVAELPARWELLTIDGHGMRLRLLPSMDVRLADGAAVRTRAELEAPGGGVGAAGAAAAAARVLEVPLAAGGRGKVM